MAQAAQETGWGYAEIIDIYDGSASNNLLHSLLFNKLTWIHIFSACKYFLKYRGKTHPRHTNEGD